MNILVSACLLGIFCRYDGASKPNAAVLALADTDTLIPVCPEQLGGLPTPRTPVECTGTGALSADGQDCTEFFLRGAKEALRIAQITGCTHAVLKARSPSCGIGQIYDGSFSGMLIPGDGFAAKLLREAGLCLIDEEQLAQNRRAAWQAKG